MTFLDLGVNAFPYAVIARIAGFLVKYYCSMKNDANKGGSIMKEEKKQRFEHGALLLTFEFAGLPPTVNLMYRGLQGHRYKTQATLTFTDQVSTGLRQAWGSQPRYEGRLEMTITLYTNTRRRWDIDNRIKALQDCLMEAGVIKDDSQIDKLIVERRRGKREHTVLTLYEYDFDMEG